MQVTIGYYPDECDIQTGHIRLASLPDFASKVADVRSHPNTHNGWCYSPSQRNIDMMTGRETLLPQRSRIFGLPKTHVLEHASSNSPDHIDFLVWCIGFFTGFPLTALEYGCLDAAPVERERTMNDFFVPEAALSDAIALSERYWRTYSSSTHPRMPKRLTGIIHCLVLSQTPTSLPYERFMYSYMAIDACYRQTVEQECFAGRRIKREVKHAERAAWTCNRLGMPDPAIEVYELRNDTFHEALFFDEPLGFMSPKLEARQIIGTLMYMRNLVCRLVVALMDAPCRTYIESDPKTREPYDLSFRKA